MPIVSDREEERKATRTHNALTAKQYNFVIGNANLGSAMILKYFTEHYKGGRKYGSFFLANRMTIDT